MYNIAYFFDNGIGIFIECFIGGGGGADTFGSLEIASEWIFFSYYEGLSYSLSKDELSLLENAKTKGLPRLSRSPGFLSNKGFFPLLEFYKNDFNFSTLDVFISPGLINLEIGD